MKFIWLILLSTHCQAAMYFSMERLQENQKINRVRDLRFYVTFGEPGVGIDQFQMTAIVKEISNILRIAGPIGIQWHPIREVMLVQLNPYRPWDNENVGVIDPKETVRSFTPQTRHKILHLLSKMHNRSLNKILRSFDGVRIN